MILATVYLGENKQGGFFNIPSNKKTSSVFKKEKPQKLSDVVVDNALSKLKSDIQQHLNKNEKK